MYTCLRTCYLRSNVSDIWNSCSCTTEPWYRSRYSYLGRGWTIPHSNPGRSKWFLCYPKCLERLWVPSCLLHSAYLLEFFSVG
jgi:hypothetical protein